MKISELSQRSGIPLATIKFYLRERLLPPGEVHGPNQARYTEEHLRRLQLIRALKDAGKLSLQAIRQVTALIDAPDEKVWEVLGVAVDALSARPAEPSEKDAERQRAERELKRLLDDLGWNVRSDAAAFQDLVDSYLSIRRLWLPDSGPDSMLPYAQAMQALAEREVCFAAQKVAGDATDAVEAAVLGTVLIEPMLIALRRLVHEHLAYDLVHGTQPSSAPRATPSER